MGNIARDGAPKKLAPVEIHGGMYHFTKNGVLARGLSKTQSAVLDGGLPVDDLTKGKVEKRFYSESTPVYPGHRSRTGATQDANAVLSDSTKFWRDVSAPGNVKGKP
jgi:hypothetical protein